MKTDASTATQRIARAAGMVMVAFIINNLASLTRQILVARAFGTGMEIEAFNATNRVSETLFNLVAGGAMASAFIPTFTGLLVKEKRKEAWQLASSITNLALLVFTGLCLIAALFAPQIVRHLLAPGFAANPTKEALAIALLRIQLPSAAIFGLSSLVSGILNSNQVFFVPALTPSMYHIGIIFGVTVLAQKMGIYGLAWGVVIGSSMHLALQLPSLWRQRGQYIPMLGLKLDSVQEVLLLMLPRLFGVAAVQLNFWINTRLASTQPEGSVTGIQLGLILMLMPQAAIAQSIAIAAMPTFSAQYARGQLADIRSSLAASLRGLLLLSIPATFGLILLRRPIVAMLFQRGEFTERSTELVAWALLWYGVGLVGHCIVEILARTFYAMHDTRTPVLVGAAAMGLNVGFSFMFSALFNQAGWLPHGGLALANSVATALEAAGLFWLIRKRLKGLQMTEIFKASFQALLAALIMAAGIGLWLRFTPFSSYLILALGGVILGGGIYAAIVLVLGIKEARAAWKIILRRLRRSES
jgi:putative peptidoglycan lipid II flippase